MIILEVIFALLIALFITTIFSFVFKTKGPWKEFWVLFIILFLIALAGGRWIRPFGPQLWGIYWVPFFFSAMLIAFLIAAIDAANPHRPRSRHTNVEEKIPENQTATAAILGTFFWILILILIAIIILSYF